MRLTRRSTNFSYFELLDACKEPGCPICRLGHRSAKRHLDSVIYDGVNDIPLRATLRESYGYCYEHAWLLPESGDSAPLGIAIIHRDILNTLRTLLGKESFGKERRTSLRQALTSALGTQGVGNDPSTARHLPARASCPACERRDEAEGMAFQSLLEALAQGDNVMESALAASDGLCVAHLRHALADAGNLQAFETIVATTQAQLSALIADLDEFIRKSDHRFRDEKISMQEGESWKRALQRASGSRPDQRPK